LVFNFDWKVPFIQYHKRCNFYWGFSVEDANIHLLEGKFETVDDSDVSNIKYLIEVAVSPEKISHEHFDHLNQIIKDFENDDSFKVWWVGDNKTEKKKSKAQKKQVLKDLNGIGVYQTEDDIDLDIEEFQMPVEESLDILGFAKESTKKEIEKNLKQRVRELVLKYHPDVNEGDDIQFKKIQNGKERLQEWIDEES
jgi:hypothetical protein